MNELTAKAADAIISICNDLVIDNIEGEKAVPEWRYQTIEKIESWAKAIRDAHRPAKQGADNE
ncbi:hypothetical protein F885_01795 [Acinetobacter higginsii]|uniref:hypothetical protein n=1 Tax=Acinetobacter higginsii TaxID=70347 RepID=UPI0002CE48D4|nr:hypothetical protein [Acinetobacter higginsii]ENX60687.1 hypothetical protein F885_01795 [Acinetobacter higginsii]